LPTRLRQLVRLFDRSDDSDLRKATYEKIKLGKFV